MATDIETGDAVIIKNGNLAKAMRASMSIPGVLPPIKIDGKLLVDGGIGNNVPINVARDMGADIVIVVDVSAPLASQEDLQSSIAVTAQLSTIIETTLDQNAPENALFRRGGFFELSGFLNRQLAGQHFGLVEAAFYRRLGNFTLLPLYAGFSVETGNTWDDRDEISLNNSVLAGSVFLGADTILGPLYLAYGINDNNASTVYIIPGTQMGA
jgi:hypothetical protein